MKCAVNMEQLRRGPDASFASHLPSEKEKRSAGGLHCSQKAECGSDTDQKKYHNVNVQHVLKITDASF